jgi:hypothetical protein
MCETHRAKPWKTPPSLVNQEQKNDLLFVMEMDARRTRTNRQNWRHIPRDPAMR